MHIRHRNVMYTPDNMQTVTVFVFTARVITGHTRDLSDGIEMSCHEYGLCNRAVMTSVCNVFTAWNVSVAV